MERKWGGFFVLLILSSFVLLVNEEPAVAQSYLITGMMPGSLTNNSSLKVGDSTPSLIGDTETDSDSDSLQGSVTLQGRPTPPAASWSVPLTIILTNPGETTPLYTYVPTTDTSGQFTVSGITPGTYDVWVKNSHTLQNVKTVTLLTGTNVVDFGTLLEGDANNDNVVTLVDFSILASTFGKCQGTTGYDDWADFNQDTCITLPDFSLLATNFGKAGPIRLPSSTPVCGTISTNTTWLKATSPYTVSCDVTVNSGVTLSIEPGVEVRVNQNYGLIINGTLSSVGTASQLIRFTANTLSPTSGYWKGISFGSSSVNSRLEYVQVNYGGYGGNGNIRSSGSALELIHSSVSNSSNYGIYGTSLTSITISETVFTDNTTYAAWLGLTNGTLKVSNVSGSGNGSGIILLDGSLGGSTILEANPTLPYGFNALTINSGATLTLQSGVIFKPRLSDTSGSLGMSVAISEADQI
jgi:hypothetical protein